MGKVNLVFEATDKRIIPEVMEMIRKTKVTGVDLKEMEYFIYQNLGKSDTKLWVLFDGDKINGFTLAYIVYPAIKPEVFIAWAYSDPKVKKGGKMMMEAIEAWTRKLKIGKISAMVRDNLEAFQKSYGFTLEYYGVGKELKQEETK